MDNVFVERLWRSVKYENVYLNNYESARDAQRGLREYFNFYNNERPHQALDYRTPAEVHSVEGGVKELRERIENRPACAKRSAADRSRKLCLNLV